MVNEMKVNVSDISQVIDGYLKLSANDSPQVMYSLNSLITINTNHIITIRGYIHSHPFKKAFQLKQTP